VTWLAVAIGGALGSMARYGVGLLVQERFMPARFPMATAIVNLSGCFAIGLLAGLIASDRLTLRVPAREFVFVGLLGGFTTFSAFGLETLTLLRGNAPGVAAANIALQVVGGLAAAWIGYQLGARS
jgi:CrcB protein